MLAGQERGQVRAAGRNAVAAVEGDAVLQTPVEHARAEDRAITAAHVDDGRLMRRRLCCLYRLRCLYRLCCLCCLCRLRHRQNPFRTMIGELTRLASTFPPLAASFPTHPACADCDTFVTVIQVQTLDIPPFCTLCQSHDASESAEAGRVGAGRVLRTAGGSLTGAAGGSAGRALWALQEVLCQGGDVRRGVGIRQLHTAGGVLGSQFAQ